jgi:hypothetical protein
VNLKAVYFHLVIKKPAFIVACFAALLLPAAYYARYFELDASGESLILENDPSLNYYRQIAQKYASDDFVVIAYKPDSDLLSAASIRTIRALRDDLLALDNIDSVVSILDVPIIYESGLRPAELAGHLQSIDSGFDDYAVAEREFKVNPLYRDLLVNDDATITAIQAVFKRDREYESLLNRRMQLQSSPDVLSDRESAELARLNRDIRDKNQAYTRQRDRDIRAIRRIIDRYRATGTLYLGGIPMITVDMIQFIRHDLVVFGSGVIVFLLIILWLFFHRLYWVLLPLLICMVTGWLTVGVLGFADWAVTVISSNFLSILLIITLSLAIHLIARYLDLQHEHPATGQAELVRLTVASMALPCLYTVLTTVVAFASLVVCEIRPVINFGWIMIMGLSIAFVVSFTLMPALMALRRHVDRGAPADITRKITLSIAGLVQATPSAIVILATLLIVLSIAGITRLEVENRFINNFKADTEIYRGMKLIDDELGGTMPLDIILDPDPEFLESILAPAAESPDTEEFFPRVDDAGEEPGYWLNSTMMDKAERIHEHLESYPVVGKVNSFVASLRIFEKLNGAPFDAFELGLLRKRVPESVAADLFQPYLSEDANQLRFSLRIVESDPELKRNELLANVRDVLINDMELHAEQVHLTGMMVLYNNMLQSLYRSQVLSIGAVSAAIMYMFLILFRNLRIALIAVVPNLFSTVMIMGVMGWAGIPLDMMTITIASITLGISVDNTIHYLHRIQKVFPQIQDYRAAVTHCHGGIGKAMYYTSVAIIFGFAILAFSNFIPTIYFGLLVGCAIFIALVGDLVLLPAIILLAKPRLA